MGRIRLRAFTLTFWTIADGGEQVMAASSSSQRTRSAPER